MHIESMRAEEEMEEMENMQRRMRRRRKRRRRRKSLTVKRKVGEIVKDEHVKNDHRGDHSSVRLESILPQTLQGEVITLPSLPSPPLFPFHPSYPLVSCQTHLVDGGQQANGSSEAEEERVRAKDALRIELQRQQLRMNMFRQEQEQEQG
eukprot:763778-Hanusia_phi.AAC.20